MELTAEIKAKGFSYFSMKRNMNVTVLPEKIPESAVYFCRSYDCKKVIVQTAGIPYNHRSRMNSLPVIPGYDPAFMHVETPVYDPSHFQFGMVPISSTEELWFSSDKKVDPGDVVKRAKKINDRFVF